MKNTDLFQNEGNVISVEGNKPLLLSDPGYVWMVEQGKVSVFSVQVIDDRAEGARCFLLDSRPGDILFGIGPEGGSEKLGLLATGLTGTSLIRISRSRFLKLLESSDIAAMIRRWVRALAKGTATAGEPEIEIADGYPRVFNVDGKAEDLTLDQFHSLALQSESKRREDRLLAAAGRFHKKAENERLMMENAIGRLLSVTRQGRGTDLEENAGDSLLDACRLVGGSMKIKIVPPPPSRRGPSGDPLGEIAAASRIRVRQVILKGEWWRKDNGPLLAYLEEDNRPVALIPRNPSSYDLYDPADKSRVQVNIRIAELLKPFAFTFYRPFPERALKLRDIMVLGMESCWKQDLAVVFLMGILGGLLGMVVPVATGIVFDSIIPGGEKSQLLNIAIFLGAGALAELIFQLTRSLATLRMEGKMEESMEAAVWDRLLSLPAPFFKQFTAGELAMRAQGISLIRRTLSGVTIITIFSSIFSIFNFALLFYYDVRLAGIAAALTAAVIAVDVALGYWQISYERKVVDITNRIAGLVLQIIGGISKFKVSGAENRAFHLWSSEFSEERKLVFKKETIANYLEAFNSFLPVLTSIVIFYAVVSSKGQSLPAGKFIAFNAAFTLFMTAMIALSKSLVAINVIIPLYERAKPILETLPEYDEAKVDPGELTGSLEVSHLYFRYKADGPLILDDVTLQIKEGEYVGLVGPSGSGKSTLFRLLLGFEKPESGRIYFSGQDIEKVDIRSLRRQLGVVLQNGKLLSGDIFTNIVGSNPSLTMDDAWEAAGMSGLDRDIREMPMGMHTVVSEGGGTLSGGQRQRLLIARAIVSKPRIVFFDEATSALDNRTQAVVSQSLEGLKATRVVIAHRLSTVMNCDRIIVMERGRIIEQGHYNDLMKMNGVFTELAKRQLA